MSFVVMFNNGICEDTVSFKIKAFNEEEALLEVLAKNPEYSGWKNYVR
jgi:hypothetical protein